ncbi:MAG: glycosyltransferase family 2 protein [Gammaproteobacteria bacterium]
MSGAELWLWSALGVLVFTYVGYPLLLTAWAVLRPRHDARVPDGRSVASVTVVIAAYNEEACIRQKIANLLASDFPAERLEIIVASDGSTDDTVARAEECQSDTVRVVAFPARRGKAAVLNDIVPLARGELVVFADARQRFESSALSALSARFAEAAVGAVGGELVLVDTQANGSEVTHGVSAYWRYEKFIRKQESRVDSTVGVSGAIYAIRKPLFKPIPPDVILDDVLIPMAVVAQGYRVVFEPSARAYDRTAPTAAAEFRRKVRTLAGNFQLFTREPWLLMPWRNRLWVQTIAHKLCRLLGPFALVVLFATSAMLAGDPVYAALFAAQLLFYLGAALGLRFRDRPRKPFLFNLPYTFCLLNWATVVGLVRWIVGRQSVMWQSNNVR